jgi:hypothetical protein
MTTELQHKPYRGKWIILHDSGDFLSDAYLLAWLGMMHKSSQVHFYCSTKSMTRFRRLVESDPPDNLLWCYSGAEQ